MVLYMTYPVEYTKSGCGILIFNLVDILNRCREKLFKAVYGSVTTVIFAAKIVQSFSVKMTKTES